MLALAEVIRKTSTKFKAKMKGTSQDAKYWNTFLRVGLEASISLGEDIPISTGMVMGRAGGV